MENSPSEPELMENSPSEPEPMENSPSEQNGGKYDALYRRIVKYMERDEPFCKPSFSITHIATAIDSNVSTVAKVIKKITDMHIKAFINSYRLEFAKKMLQKADAKFTIEHLSQSAGFKNQSTFNKVFKIREGITPTEYMNLHQKKIEDVPSGTDDVVS
jgi:AraC-like DNA-binding protein